MAINLNFIEKQDIGIAELDAPGGPAVTNFIAVARGARAGVWERLKFACHLTVSRLIFQSA